MKLSLLSCLPIGTVFLFFCLQVSSLSINLDANFEVKQIQKQTGSKKLLSEISDFFKTILQHNGKNLVDLEGLKILMNLFDGEDGAGRCGPACEYYLQDMIHQFNGVGKKADDMTFDDFEKLITAIYGDAVSDDPYQPQEVHLSITSDPTEMKVMFVTMEPLTKPFVEYQPTATSENPKESVVWDHSMVAMAINYTYSVPQKWWPVFTGVIYEVDMAHLASETSYSYRVGGYSSANQTIRYSDTFQFKSMPHGFNRNRKTVVSTLADHGTFMLFGFLTTNKIAELMGKRNIDFAFVAGDLSYAGLDSAVPQLNISKTDEFEHIWDLWGIQNEPVSSTIPWLVGQGNHDKFYDSAAFINRFKMPQMNSLSNGSFWYDFDYANIHWISINSEADLSEGSPQKAFIISSLEAAQKNRFLVPWIVATIHKPLYCSDVDTPGGFADLLEDLFLEYDVDLVISGHLHAYERIHPVNQSKVTRFPIKLDGDGIDAYHSTGKGPVYVVQGNTGAMQWERWSLPQPEWSAIRFANGWEPNRVLPTNIVDYRDKYNYTNTFGFGLISVENATHMYYEAFADTEDALGTDKFWIIKRV